MVKTTVVIDLMKLVSYIYFNAHSVYVDFRFITQNDKISYILLNLLVVITIEYFYVRSFVIVQ